MSMSQPFRGPEIADLRHLDDLLGRGDSLRGARFQDLDLSARSTALLTADLRDVTVFGGRVPTNIAEHIISNGGAIFPTIRQLPINPYRSGLYTASDLYDGLDRGYESTLDHRAYRWSHAGDPDHDIQGIAMRALHDAAMHDALADYTRGRSIFGVMGGHALQRGTPGFAFAALLGHGLVANQHTVATGGGPGAMEAANLGAWFGTASAADVQDACRALAEVPTFSDITVWARAAFAVRGRVKDPRPRSLAIPTWFYGHEPPNVFSNHIAKYFSNALREDILLTHSTAGVLYLPGAAGTVQEIFQAATRGYYSDTGGVPLILVGRRYWTQVVPAWDLLQGLAAHGAANGREAFEANIHLIPGLDEAPIDQVVDDVLTIAATQQQSAA